MKEIDAINTVGREAFRAKFSWIRYVTGLSIGAFTVLITFHSNFIGAPIWSFRACLISLFLSVFLGTLLLLRESVVSERLLSRLVAANAGSGVHPDLIEAIAIPVLSKSDKLVFRVFYLAFLVSLGFLLLYALQATGTQQGAV
ncbi:MAG: hypothetical protein O3C43_11065 [Verrucomicrobia bacterium]|nr:hypothetical protein [Verrucomicrobiota bacterium]